MDVLGSMNDARARFPGCAVAIGNFDGVHKGHQELVAQARRHAQARGAKTIVLAFDPHPAKVLNPALAPPLICPLERRLELLGSLGVDAAVVQRFDAAFMGTAADLFVAMLLETLAPHDIVVGYDFTYGRGRAGTTESLRLAAEESGAHVHVVPPVSVDGLTVSSTKIRELVLEGKVDQAARLLGRSFDLSGEIVQGAGRGRTLGFPTANLRTANELLPAMGVYASRMVLPDGRSVAGATNVGLNPTFTGGAGAPLMIETYLLDFRGDLYGQRVRLELVQRLRPEQKFPSVDVLREQIRRDVEQVRLLGV